MKSTSLQTLKDLQTVEKSIIDNMMLTYASLHYLLRQLTLVALQIANENGLKLDFDEFIHALLE